MSEEWPVEVQLTISAVVFVGYAVFLRTLVKREEKKLNDIFNQRADFLDRMWESKLPPEHLQAAGIMSQTPAIAPLMAR